MDEQAKLYGSKEIYKVIWKDGQKRLVPLSGLYIAGKHLEPTYQEPITALLTISSPPATVVDYSTQYADAVEEGTYGLVDIDVNDTFVYTPYTRAYDSAYTEEGTYGLVDMDVNDTFTLQKYTRDNESCYVEEGTYGLTSLSIDNVYDYHSITSSSRNNVEPSVKMTSLTVSPLVYEDVNS